ncbi:MAG: TIGR01212 family radical SAM protein [Bacteroidales bacterium]|jgi:radical SAM protein (TIGR01212 family)|nr:TIGR01212 family radical SAM protein [Bacteroidales bacterium]OQC46883.1 MAG: Oxygen-independent coproporphyrinogen-III oxidase 2 [Bacteroidetes bacterium ADurb.Bin028]
MQNKQNTKLPWNDYSSYIKRIFGIRVQKISIDAGFTCPNRDGKISRGACFYCTNESFSPFYCTPKLSVTEQLQKGIEFFSKKYKTQKYLAYFQSYTNTYGKVEDLKKLYLEALAVEGVIGLVIATRPDCIDEEIMKMLKEISKDKYLSIEYGAESTKNETLNFINRGHSWEQTIKAVELANNFQINCGLHFIIGLPGEDKTDFLNHAKKISKLNIQTLKIHQMQVLKKTKLADVYKESPELFYNLNLENYLDLMAEFLSYLNPNVVVERFTSESPKEMIIYPNWQGKKNFEISHMLEKKMNERKITQGMFFEANSI